MCVCFGISTNTSSLTLFIAITIPTLYRVHALALDDHLHLVVPVGRRGHGHRLLGLLNLVPPAVVHVVIVETVVVQLLRRGRGREQPVLLVDHGAARARAGLLAAAALLLGAGGLAVVAENQDKL